MLLIRSLVHALTLTETSAQNTEPEEDGSASPEQSPEPPTQRRRLSQQDDEEQEDDSYGNDRGAENGNGLS